MEIILYQNYYEFHFWAGLNPAQLAEFLNMLPLGFKLKAGTGGMFVDSERGPGVFLLRQKSTPQEETPLSSQQANYYLRWTARASEGNLPQMALRLAAQLSAETETQVWLVDGYGRVLHQEGGSFLDERSA